MKTLVNTIKGRCLGVEIYKEDYDWEGELKTHFLVEFLVEDDGSWCKQDLTFDTHWLDDCIEVLQKAKKYCA